LLYNSPQNTRTNYCTVTLLKISDCKASLTINTKSETPTNNPFKILQDILNSVPHKHLRTQKPNSYLQGRPVREHKLIEVDMDYGSQNET